MKTKFLYGEVEYPYTNARELGREERIVFIIPDVTGDYFLAKIDSSGNYKLLEEVSESDVTVITANQNGDEVSGTVPEL